MTLFSRVLEKENCAANVRRGLEENKTTVVSPNPSKFAVKSASPFDWNCVAKVSYLPSLCFEKVHFRHLLLFVVAPERRLLKHPPACCRSFQIRTDRCAKFRRRGGEARKAYSVVFCSIGRNTLEADIVSRIARRRTCHFVAKMLRFVPFPFVLRYFSCFNCVLWFFFCLKIFNGPLKEETKALEALPYGYHAVLF